MPSNASRLIFTNALGALGRGAIPGDEFALGERGGGGEVAKEARIGNFVAVVYANYEPVTAYANYVASRRLSAFKEKTTSWLACFAAAICSCFAAALSAFKEKTVC